MPSPTRPRRPLLALMLLLAACGGGTTSPVVTPPQSLGLSGDASQVLAGGKSRSR